MSANAPAGTFNVCTDGEDFPADLTEGHVEASVHRAIAREIANRIGAPVPCVRVDNIDFWTGTGYVGVTVTIQAPFAGPAGGAS